jgi:hypothetical protein
MAFFPRVAILCVLQILFCPVHSVLSVPHSILDLESNDFLSLHAATRHADIHQRDVEIRLSNTVHLDFIDRKSSNTLLWVFKNYQLTFTTANYNGQGPVFFSKVHVESSRPLLLLEQIEHHLENILCDASTIELEFSTTYSYTMAKDLVSHLVGSYVITSHDGCNNEGTRLPFL